MADAKDVKTAEKAKTETETALTISQKASAKPLALNAADVLAKAKIARMVTLPVLKLEEYQPVIVVFAGPMKEGKDIEGKREKDADAKVAILAPVRDVLDRMSEKQIVVPAVVEGVLTDEYPNNSYVGKVFAIEKLDKVPGKRYFNYRVAQLDAESVGIK